MKKLIAMLLMLVAAQASAVNWDRVAIGNVAAGEGYYLYINEYTIETSGKLTQVWVFSDYQKEQTNQASGEKYRSLEFLYSFDCAEKKFSTAQELVYEKNLAVGKVLSSRGSKDTYEDVVAGSEVEMIFNKVCKFNK